MDVAHPESADQAGEVINTASPRDRLIAAATRLFCRYGVNSVGVDEIVAAATTAKTTLYRLFGSKDGLVEAVLESEGRTWRTWFLAEIDGPGGTALARLHRIGPALRLWFDREDFYGCPFINAVSESDKADNRMRVVGDRAQEGRARTVGDALHRGRLEGAEPGGAFARPDHRWRDRGRTGDARPCRCRDREPDLRERAVGRQRLT